MREQGSLLTLSPDADRGGAADPPALLTRFAEELRRAPVAGGGEEIFDFGCFPAVAGHAYAWIFNYL